MQDLAGVCQQYGMTDVIQAQTRLDLGWDYEKSVLCPSLVTIQKINNSFGLHFIMDGYKANTDKLSDLNHIFQFLNLTPEKVGMTKITQPHVFQYSGVVPEDYGVTGSVILAESHASIHTFPGRDGFFSFDLYSCKYFNPYNVLQEIKQSFDVSQYHLHLVIRGTSFCR